MKEQVVQSALNPLWASYIDRLETDLRSHTITIDLTAYGAGKQSRHKLVFDGIASFYFVASYGDSRFNQENWENVELSEIYYFQESQRNEIVQTCSKPGVRPHRTAANFVLEIWDAELFIEANAVTIDGQRFEVGYPERQSDHADAVPYTATEQSEGMLAEKRDEAYRTGVWTDAQNDVQTSE